jgi:hypothetical protein
VGGADCKAVPADESSSMTSTQTALASHERPVRGDYGIVFCPRPLASACNIMATESSQDHSRLSPSLSVCATLGSVVYV